MFKKYNKYEEFKEVLLTIKMEEFLTRAISAKTEISLEMFEIIKEKFRDFDYSVFNLGKIEKIKNLYDKIIKMSDKEFLIYADKVKKAGQNG